MSLRTPADHGSAVSRASDERHSRARFRDRLVAMLAKPAALVVDPFVGQGTTGVAAVMEATNCSKMTLFVNDLDNVISYRDLMNPAPIEKLSRVGKACMLVGLSRKADRDKALRENRAADAEKLKAEALKFYEASFSLGYKLCAERVRWPEFDAGWTLIALEWEREVETSSTPEPEQLPAAAEEIPFGLRIGSDCRHLEDDPLEMQTLRFVAEMIVQDISFTSMADALNVREYRTRDGRPWNAAAVFKLTPRLIEVAPRILSGAEWESRKKQLYRVTWNS